MSSRKNMIPTPYEEGVEMGQDLYRQGIQLSSLAPLTVQAKRLGYTTEKEQREWARGVIHGYSKVKEKEM